MKRSLKVFAAISMVAMLSPLAVSTVRADDHAGGNWDHHDPDPAAVGFLAALEAALLTTISADATDYDAQTLQVQAAAYLEDSRVKGAVFDQFAKQEATEHGVTADQVSQAQFDQMVANDILQSQNIQ